MQFINNPVVFIDLKNIPFALVYTHNVKRYVCTAHLYEHVKDITRIKRTLVEIRSR